MTTPAQRIEICHLVNCGTTDLMAKRPQWQEDPSFEKAAGLGEAVGSILLRPSGKIHR